MAVPTCSDNPATLWRLPACVGAVSKNLFANLRLERRERQRCADRRCVTLKTLHWLQLEMSPYECDSRIGRRLTGLITVKRLVTAFDRNGIGRGVHSGDFVWTTPGAVEIAGRMSGITNAGLLRPPAFRRCEDCSQPLVLYGRLCGQVVKTPIAELRGCQVMAMYRIALDADENQATAGLDQAGGRGTLEGAVMCPCRT